MKKSDETRNESINNQEPSTTGESTSQDPNQDDDRKLTPRQEGVLRALLEGLSYSEAAKKAGVARQTVYNYLKDPLFEKELKRGQGEIHDAARRRASQPLWRSPPNGIWTFFMRPRAQGHASRPSGCFT